MSDVPPRPTAKRLRLCVPSQADYTVGDMKLWLKVHKDKDPAEYDIVGPKGRWKMGAGSEVLQDDQAQRCPAAARPPQPTTPPPPPPRRRPPRRRPPCRRLHRRRPHRRRPHRRRPHCCRRAPPPHAAAHYVYPHEAARACSCRRRSPSAWANPNPNPHSHRR